MRNNTTFTLPKFRNNLSGIFTDFQGKVQSQKCPTTYWLIVYVLVAYRGSQSGLPLYPQFLTTENIYLLNNTFLQKHTVINIGKKKVVGVW